MAAQGTPVTLTASGVWRQTAVDYSGGDVDLPVTDGLGCNTAGTVVFLDGEGNSCTRAMLAGVDYSWQVTRIVNSGTTASMGIYALYSK